MLPSFAICFFFFFNDTATTEIYTLSLHDALPICPSFVVRGGAIASSLAELYSRRCLCFARRLRLSESRYSSISAAGWHGDKRSFHRWLRMEDHGSSLCFPRFPSRSAQFRPGWPSHCISSFGIAALIRCLLSSHEFCGLVLLRLVFCGFGRTASLFR